MAAVTLTPSRPRFGSTFSSSTSRPNAYSTDALSMADSLPTVNFGFEELRERMAQFTARFDDFIERGRKRVLEERNQFRLNVAEIQGQSRTVRNRSRWYNSNTSIESQRTRRREIDIIEDQSAAHQNSLVKESQEQEEMHEAIADLKARKEDHLAHRDELSTAIAEVQKAIHVRKQAQQQHKRALDSQARHNGPELDFWETTLCLRIEGTGVDDQLRFLYSHVDEQDWEKECWFQVDMGGREYEIIGTEPQLEREALQTVLDRLNETRELATFLKGMRSLFVEAVKA